jgi:hypothetical protein
MLQSLKQHELRPKQVQRDYQQDLNQLKRFSQGEL